MVPLNVEEWKRSIEDEIRRQFRLTHQMEESFDKAVSRGIEKMEMFSDAMDTLEYINEIEEGGEGDEPLRLRRL